MVMKSHFYSFSGNFWKLLLDVGAFIAIGKVQRKASVPAEQFLYMIGMYLR